MTLTPSSMRRSALAGLRLRSRAVLGGALLLTAACATAGGGARGLPPTDERLSLRRAIDSMVAEPKFRSMQWGILVVDPARGDTLYSHNAGKLFIPASNQKILTGAVALHQLGPDWRFATTVSRAGELRDGALHGDLVIEGTGDPSVSDAMAGDAMAPLRAIADSLASRGIRRVTGTLLRGGDTFPDATLGAGWAWDDLDFPYSAGVDELYLNEGFSRVIVRGGTTAGEPARVSTAPARTFPRVTSVATTIAGATPRRGAGGPRVRHDSGDVASVIVEGSVGAGDSVVLTIAHRDQNAAYLLALREALLDRGITVAGAAAAAPEATVPLFTLHSPPLRQVLSAFEKPSQNQIGEILLKTLGRVRSGVGTTDSGVVVVRRQLQAWGVAPDGAVVRDGSGLSRHNVVTPEAIVRVLDAMRGDSAFDVFHASLPIAGVDGTIANRMRDTPAQRNVHAKTGTLDMVRSLSGYVTTADGRRLLFAMLANNWTVPVREIERVQDDVAVRLARLGAPGSR